ncbi:MAG TPA: DUF4249 domain-containing protein [Chitinophaga sp.]|uniref:DUF4249 domain-containing protein n=1 Tax=Chitinophaga sp. TaxID=1869181 RepID=UPI002F9295A4
MRPAYMLIGFIITLLSCEKVIDLDLNTAPPGLVIEGTITNQVGSYMVQLSKTTSYTAPNEFVPVSAAIVIISDQTGVADTLKESSAGKYQGTKLKGKPGHTYQLQVRTGDEVYTASSVMPAAVSIDTLIQGEKKGSDGKIAVQTWFHDPAGTEDYYRFSFSVNGVLSESIFPFDGRLYDGTAVRYDLAREDDEEEKQGLPPVKAGDTVEVTLYHIDQPVYNYFLILQQNSGNGPPAAPGNPVSNISNGALGYFSAHTVAKRAILIK